MNVLLIYPLFPFSFWSMKDLLKMAGKKASYPPLGLLTVAALLPKEWNKRLVDTNVKVLTDEDLQWADYAVIGAMNVQAESAQAIITRCKKFGLKVLAGGPLFTHEYERFEGVDHFILNEGEITIPMFLEDLRNGCPKPVYSTNEFADVTQSPIPLWELADMNDYAYAVVQYSRGCPYMCDFCDVTALFGRRPRTKTPAQMIAELEALGDLNRFDLAVFADDNLMGNKKLLKSDLLPALIEWRKRKQLAIGFATQITINLADDEELMRLMLEAGFRHIFIGIETPDDDALKHCKKSQNTRRNMVENIKRLHGSGFIITAGFIVGFDTDEVSIFQRQIDFIQESGIVIAGISVLKAPPGTELYNRMKREERLIEDFNFHESETNFVPKMDPQLLRDGYRTVLENVYSPEMILERAKTFIRDYNAPTVNNAIPMLDLRQLGMIKRYLGILFRILYHTLFTGPLRMQVWKLLRWTWSNRREHIDLALLYAVWMYEFRNIYRHFLESTHLDADKLRTIPSSATKTGALPELNLARAALPRASSS